MFVDLDEESVAKIVFLRFDPILRMLLTEIKQYHSFIHNNNNNNNNEQRRREELGLLRSIAQNLTILQQLMNDPVYEYQGYILTERQIRQSFFLLFDYISLPLLALLRMPTATTTTPSSADNTSTDIEQQQQLQQEQRLSEQHLIRQSASWKCIQFAARTLQVTIERMYQQKDSCSSNTLLAGDDDDNDAVVGFVEAGISANSYASHNNIINNNKNKKNGQQVIVSSWLSPNMIHKCLTACACALPCGEEVITSRERKHATIIMSLDSGEDRVACILDLISCIVTYCCCCRWNKNNNNNIQEEGQTNVLEDGAHIVFRILDSAVAIIEPPVSSADNDNNINKNNTPNSSKSWMDDLSSSSSSSTGLQISALKAIHALLEIPSTNNTVKMSIWYKVFPGVYAGLYRRALQSICLSRTKGTQVAILSIQTICKLLRLCLRDSDDDDDDAQQQQQRRHENNVSSTTRNTVSSTMHALEQLANRNGNVTVTSMHDQSDEKVVFFQQVLRRVPSTLIVLINLITTANSSAIREQAINLNRIVLIDTSRCWKRVDRNHDDVKIGDLTTKAIESCLALTSGESDEVSSSANKLIEEFSNSTITGHEIGQSIAPRIISLIESLPLLVQRQRDTELQATLKLVVGYLTMNISGKKSSKLLRTSLSSENTSRIIRKALSFILDVDFGDDITIQSGRIVVLSEADLVPQNTTNNLRYLSIEAQKLVITMIRALGRVLGPKHASVYVDECVADLYDAFIERANGVQHSRSSFVGHSQAPWLHEIIGSILLVQHILMGTFAVESKDDPLSSKEARKLSKSLTTIANSILPLITSHPMWDLPTVAIESMKPHEHISQPRRGSAVMQDQSFTISTHEAASHRCNALMIGLLLDLVGTMFVLLDSEGKPVVSLVLFPIIEKTSSMNPSLIQQKALSVLKLIVSSCQFFTVAELLSENVGILTGTILGRLRLPGGRNLSTSDDLTETLISSVSAVTSLLHLLRDANGMKLDKKFSGLPLLHSIEEITYEFMARFDYASTRINHTDSFPVLFLSLFDAAILLLLLSYEVSDTGTRLIPAENMNGVNEPWFAVLSEFQKESSSCLSPEAGFAKFREEKEADASVSDHSFASCNGSLVRDTEFASKVASRCCYLISHSSLRVQIKSCDVLANCFSFLGWVSSDKSLTSDEANGPKTAILRLIHAAWPAISARFKATTSTLTISTQMNLILVASHHSGSSNPSNKGEQRVYLAKLYNLIAVMTECADDFMASRFRQVVWPCVGKILFNCVGQHHRFHESSKKMSMDMNYVQSLMNSEKILLHAILNCLSRVFGHRPAGEALSGLIPSAGTVIFPFLELDDEEIISNTTEALKSMIRIDGDALYGLLLQMSCEKIALCPIQMRKSTGHSDSSQTMNYSQNLAVRASELLAYIEALPEQSIS